MTLPRRATLFSQASAVVIVVLGVFHFAYPATGQQPGTRWVTAWSTSQQVLGEDRISNATVRMLARVTVPGEAIRVRLDNTFGSEPVTIARAFVGHRVRGALLAAGSNRPITFGGAAEVTIPAGGTISSDPVSLAVRAQQDIAVSMHVRGTAVRPSQHTNAAVTSYRSADSSGDVAANESAAPFEMTTTATWWLKAVDVLSPSPGTIVAFGDSITDGTCSTLDAHDRWENVLSVRLGLEHEATRQERGSPNGLKAVINEGIGGNTITREGLSPPPDSTPGLERLERDVLSHHAVSDVVLFMGTNDIRRGASAASVIEGTAAIVKRVKEKGIRIVGATIIPRHNVAPTPTNSGWNPDKTRVRNEVNQWIRMKAPFDDVIDFDKVVRDPASPDLLVPEFNCGDGIHPSPLGYYEMGRSIDLGLFRRR
jgi:lysophospholipase L1-like esterase